MRVMFIITRGDSMGGAQVHVRDLASRLTVDGHEVHVVVGTQGELTDQLQAHGVTSSSCEALSRRVDLVRDLRSVRQLRDAIIAFEPDVVATHSSKAGMIGRISSRWAKVPCTFTVHGWAFIDTVPQPIRGIYAFLERRAARLASSIICVSSQVAGMGTAAAIATDRFVVIRNGIPDVPPNLRATPGKEPVRAIMVARFAAPKDHVTVVRALAQIPELTLDFVGDGPDEVKVRRLATDLGVIDRIAFLGTRTDVDRLLAQAQIFILSSLSEAFPISTLEAMRAGLPAVVSDVGGTGEAVKNGQTGFLFERSNVAELVDRLGKLVDDPQIRIEMGRKARALYEAEFTFEHMYERTVAVYESVLAPASRSTRESESSQAGPRIA